LVVLVSIGLVLVTPAFDLASEATGGLLWALLGLLFSLLSLTNRQAPAVCLRCRQRCGRTWWSACACCRSRPWPDQRAPMDWLWIALLGVFCTGVARSLFVASLAVIKARTAAVVFGMEPVYGIAVAWAVFAETPTVRMLLGGADHLAIVLSSRWLPSNRRRSH
jgi:drug/metabolite transporter (DMT)-like permease